MYVRSFWKVFSLVLWETKKYSKCVNVNVVLPLSILFVASSLQISQNEAERKVLVMALQKWPITDIMCCIKETLQNKNTHVWNGTALKQCINIKEA